MMIYINECALERKYFVLLYFLFRVVLVAIDTWNRRKESVCNFLPCVIQIYGYGICIILFDGSFPGDWFECVYQKLVHNLAFQKEIDPKCTRFFYCLSFDRSTCLGMTLYSCLRVSFLFSSWTLLFGVNGPSTLKCPYWCWTKNHITIIFKHKTLGALADVSSLKLP